MTKLLVFTDIHMTEARTQIIGLDPYARFDAALRQALAHHPDAAAVVLLGDLTHHGRGAQYARLKAVLAQCPLPVHATIGNHDAPRVFAAAFPGQMDAGGFAQHEIDTGPARLLLLDTADRDGRAPHHGGWLCQRRLDWLDARLAEHRTKPLLVACHHPPFDTGFDGMDAIKLANGAALLDRLRAFPGPVHLMCGHIHRTISGVADGIGFTVLKSPCHQMPMILGPGSSGLSVDEPGGYGIALMRQDTVLIHCEDVGAPRPPAHETGSA